MDLRGYVARPVGIAVLVTVAGGLLASAATLLDATSRPLLGAVALTSALAVPAFLAAGVLRLARWRITGETSCLLRGGAMILMGGLALPSLSLARNLSAPTGSLTTVAFVRAVTTGVVLYVLAVALGDDDSDRDRSGLERRVGRLTIATAAATVLVLGFHDRIPQSPGIDITLARGVAVALAAAWITVAVGARVRGRHDHWARTAAPLLGAMGIAELLRVPDRPGTTLVAAAVTVSVGVLVAASALVDLVRAAQDERDETQQLTRELARARDAVWTREAWRHDLTHDARSTLAGIRAALQTLDRHADKLDAATVDRLRAATLAELGHLEHMLVRQGEDTGVFDVGEVVRTVTDVRRAAGLPMNVTVRPALVHGAPGDLATVLQNLLVNAHDHAPGARVSVEVRTDDTLVQVVVSDDGPGMTLTKADSVFERGVRGPDSRGSGLGLSIARSLVRQHGGELELRRTDGGATFVVSLPLADRSSARSAVAVS
jgi:signal transduction histidine kinase